MQGKSQSQAQYQAQYRRFRTLLIANRGEIAVRVIRTAKAMGLRTVAVYSEADRDAMHVAMADEAVLLGPARARDSYLNIERVIEAARKTGAEAVHPGYGFLSESAEFAAACLDAGLVFVGPSAAMIRAMGSKSGSKMLMEEAGVPLVPGYHGEAQDEATLADAADKIGFPVLVKASAGGGGRGMRIVRSASELAASIVSAKREAKAAFGDDRMLIEKYVDNPRHIEVQIIGDSHGNLLSLFERECTLQRRHQKVIEEAPSPTLDAAGAGGIAQWCQAGDGGGHRGLRAEIHRRDRRLLTAPAITDVRPRLQPAPFLWMWPNARISVMGGGAGGDGAGAGPPRWHRGQGRDYGRQRGDKFRCEPIRAQYERCRANRIMPPPRLWDDGVIDPADTRLVLGLGLSARPNAPIEPTRFGPVPRM